MDEIMKTGGTTKITITREAEGFLDEMLTRVNEGFGGGHLTRQDLASWVVRYFFDEAFVECMEKIRRDHFDRIAYLEHVLAQAKAAKRDGETIVDLNALLEPVLDPSKGLVRFKKRRRPVRNKTEELKPEGVT